jgi:hypothetical protein
VSLRDLSGVQINDIACAGCFYLQATFEQGNCRGVIGCRYIELSAFDDGNEQRRLHTKPTGFAMGHIVKHVATMLDESSDEVSIGGLGRDFDVTARRNGDRRLRLAEPE